MSHEVITPTVLVVGTLDTKHDEIHHLCACIAEAGGRAMVMDVGARASDGLAAAITAHQVAAAAGTTLAQLSAEGDENAVMQAMSRGACGIAARLHGQGRIDGVLMLGGTLGTDLALDVANTLPLGVPKLVLSTVAFSHLLPAERIAPDLTMMLWAGGLYGLNSLCRSALAQAAGAVVGACRAVARADVERPLVGMTSLGASALRYMQQLKPALEARGYELAVFHTTGMGGRAFERLAAEGRFVAVMDFSLQELVNHLAGSLVSCGPDRLTAAGRAGVPQLVAPGATDMVDYPSGEPPPARFAHQPARLHNRLIASVCIDAAMRREVAREIGQRLAGATGPTCLLVPTHGVEAWDRPGQPLHDPEGLAALVDELPRHLAPATRVVMLDAHINDAAFADAALAVFDQWVRDGLVPRGVTGET